MRYHVDCPHCGKPRSLPDYGLWPERGPRYPEPSEPQQCLDCPGFMRVVLDGDEVTVEKWAPSDEAKKRFEPDGIYDGKYPCTCSAACGDCKGCCGCPACSIEYNDFLSTE